MDAGSDGHLIDAQVDILQIHITAHVRSVARYDIQLSRQMPGRYQRKEVWQYLCFSALIFRA